MLKSSLEIWTEVIMLFNICIEVESFERNARRVGRKVDGESVGARKAQIDTVTGL